MESAFGVLHELSKRLPSSIKHAGTLKQLTKKPVHPYIAQRQEAHAKGQYASRLISERGGSRAKQGWTTARWNEGNAMQEGQVARSKSRKALR